MKRLAAFLICAALSFPVYAAPAQPITQAEITRLLDRFASMSTVPAFTRPEELAASPDLVLYQLFRMAVLENETLLKQGQGFTEAERAQYEREASSASFFVRWADLEWAGREIFGNDFTLPDIDESSVLGSLPGHPDVYFSKLLDGPPFRPICIPVSLEERGGEATATFHCFGVYYQYDDSPPTPESAIALCDGFWSDEIVGTFLPGSREEDLRTAFSRFQFRVPKDRLDVLTMTFRREDGRVIATSARYSALSPARERALTAQLREQLRSGGLSVDEPAEDLLRLPIRKAWERPHVFAPGDRSAAILFCIGERDSHSGWWFLAVEKDGVAAFRWLGATAETPRVETADLDGDGVLEIITNSGTLGAGRTGPYRESGVFQWRDGELRTLFYSDATTAGGGRCHGRFDTGFTLSFADGQAKVRNRFTGSETVFPSPSDPPGYAPGETVPNICAGMNNFLTFVPKDIDGDGVSELLASEGFFAQFQSSEYVGLCAIALRYDQASGRFGVVQSDFLPWQGLTPPPAARSRVPADAVCPSGGAPCAH